MTFLAKLSSIIPPRLFDDDTNLTAVTAGGQFER